MNKQQKEVQQVFLDEEKEVLKKLEETYQDAIFEINDRLERLLARQDADMQNVIYQIEYQKALKSQIHGILEQLHANEFETISQYLAKAYEDGFIGTMYDLQNQGVPLVIPIDQKQVAIAIQHETKLSEGLYAALGKDTSRLSRQIAGEISRGISNAATYEEMTRNIASYSNIPRNNAARIARTEAHRIQCQATADAQWKAKEKGADIVKQWDASLDGKTRDTHRKLDGQIRELDEPFEVDGMTAMQPGGFGDPAEDCNCRCALLQRARWALGNDFTKFDKETGGLVEIKAKDYDDFKMKYATEAERVRSSVQKMNQYGSTDVTKGWFDSAKPGVGSVKQSNEYTYNGIKYVIDGINVKQNNSKRELEVADMLLTKFGGDIQIIPEVNGKFQHVPTPDYIYNGKRFDLKEMISRKEDGIRNAVHKKKDQADNFIIDISKSEITNDELNTQIEKVFNSYNTQFVDTIMVINGDDIVKILKRK